MSLSSSEVNTPIQVLRSVSSSKRPTPDDLLLGQPAVNINISDPGLYFADSTQSELIKIGPCHVGATAPNSSPTGYVGNSVGETWLDTSLDEYPVFKVWDGSEWRSIGSSFNNTLWVDPNGSDDNSGLSQDLPKKTIKAALEISTEGTLIHVSPGTYLEDNPLEFPESGISIVGSGQQVTRIVLENDNDLFHIKDGCSVSCFSFEGDPVTSKAMVAFPPGGAGVISNIPEVKDCVSKVEGSVGVLVNGSLSAGAKAINATRFKNDGEGSVGFRVENRGFLNVSSCETHFADISVYALSGGTALVTGSKSVYGDFALVSSGTSPLEQSGEFVSVDGDGTILEVENLTEDVKPYQGQVLSVGELLYKVTDFIILSSGSGYTGVPTISISVGTGPNPSAAQALAIMRGGKLVGVKITDPGQGYTSTDVIVVTLSGGSPVSPAFVEAVTSPIYYTVINSSEIVDNACFVEIEEALPYTPNPGDEVSLFRASKITAVSHYMGYVGAGTTLFYDGGEPIQKNEALELEGGLVYYTSLDQSGTFREGDRSSTGSIQESLITEKGDIIVGLSAGTPDVLSVGDDGEVLVADSASPLGVKWETAPSTGGIPESIITEKGDIIVGLSSDTPVVLPVGDEGDVLTADPTAPSGVKWAPAPGQPNVLSEVVFTTEVLSAGSSEDFWLDLGSLITLVSVSSDSTDNESWIRMYTSESGRDSDTRLVPGPPFPPSSSGFAIEVVTTEIEPAVNLLPCPSLYSENGYFIRVVNESLVSQSFDLTFKFLILI